MRMYKKIEEYFFTNATWRKAILWFIASMVIYAVMLLVTIPSVQKFAKELRIFDMMPMGYSPQYAETLLVSLGSEGRMIYLINQIPLDFIYPGLMGLTGVLFLKLLIKNGKLQLLILLPILTALFDYLENILIALMLFTFPNFNSTVAASSSIFTILKSLFGTIYYVVLTVFIAIAIVKISFKKI